jgi:hypothetical protein
VSQHASIRQAEPLGQSAFVEHGENDEQSSCRHPTQTNLPSASVAQTQRWGLQN